MNADNLLPAALSGDESAFVGILDMLEQPVFAYFRWRRVNRHDAEDMTQQVFVALLEGGGRFDPGLGTLSAFVYGIARRVWLKHAAARGKAAGTLPAEIVDERTGSPEEHARRSERRAIVGQAVASLPEPIREVLSLRMHHSLSMNEIAATLDMPLNTVKSHLFRARVAVRERIGATFELTTISIILVILFGGPLGVLSAVRQNSVLDNVARAVAVGGVAIPSFILAMVLQMIFYGMLGWLPLQGRLDPLISLESPITPITRLYLIDAPLTGNWEGFLSALAHISLPVLTLTVLLLATVMRITRNTMIEVLNEEYIRTAFAYGVPKTSIYYRHALKATLIPMLTVIGLTYGQLLGGAVVVEFIFNWPGLGGFLVSSIIDNDFPATVGTTLFLAGIYLFVNLMVDLLYFVVDPRLRTQ